MKISILERIMCGDYNIEEEITPSKNYLKISEKCLKLYESFKKTLSEEQLESFDEFLNENMGSEYEESLSYFKEGFKLAFKIAAECFSEEEN